MKKSVISIGIISIMLIIGVLTASLIVKEKQFVEPKEKTEFTDEFLKDKNIITSIGTTDKLYNDDFATLINHSDAVVKGRVISKNYISVKGSAWTLVKFHVDDVLVGNVKVNDDIDVYFFGGYVSLEEHIKYNNDAFRYEKMSESEIKNTVIKEMYDGETEFVKENDKLILCILESSDVSPFPKGSYERHYSSGMLKLENNKYVQLYGEVKEKYSIANDKLNNIKELVKK